MTDATTARLLAEAGVKLRRHGGLALQPFRAHPSPQTYNNLVHLFVETDEECPCGRDYADIFRVLTPAEARDLAATLVRFADEIDGKEQA